MDPGATNNITAFNYFNYINDVSCDPYGDKCPTYLYYQDGDSHIEVNRVQFRLNDAQYGNASSCFMGFF